MTSLLKNYAGNEDKSRHYKEEYDRIQSLILVLFWDETDGAWYDFNLKTMDRNRHFYASMITPLFVGCVSGDGKEVSRKVDKILDYVKVYYPILKYKSIHWHEFS